MKLWEQLSYHKKIVTGMLIAALLPLAAYFFFVTQIFGVYSDSELEKEAKESLLLVSEQLNGELSGLSSAMDEMAQTPVFVSLLEEGVPGEAQVTPALYRQIHMLEQQYGRIAEFAIYDGNGRRLVTTGDGYHSKNTMALDWGLLYEAGRDPASEDVILRNATLFPGNDKESYLQLAKCVTDEEGAVRGYIVCSVYDEGFERIFGDLIPEETGCMRILDDFRKPVYEAGRASGDPAFDGLCREMLSDGKEMIGSEDGRYRYYHYEDAKSGLHFFYRQSVSTQTALRRALRMVSILAALISGILCLLLARGFSNSFYAPIDKITRAIEKIRGGDYSARIPEQDIGGDELGTLSSNVNLMAERLLENTDRLLERERELGDANIKMMQTQLNPHFLYNALDTMKWIGKQYDVPEVTTISSGLSDILRSSISRDQLVPLSSEITLIEAYAQIQQIRFDEKFELMIDIPEELLSIPVPKLILQPCVENAIVHGFENRDHGTILITGRLQGDRLILTVKDDGCGIAPEELARLVETGFASGERTGHSNIGLHHVHTIIRLHFGENYGLSLASEPGEGTIVTYTLPASVPAKSAAPEGDTKTDGPARGTKEKD